MMPSKVRVPTLRSSIAGRAGDNRRVDAELLELVSGRTNCFAACEPRRYPVALRASKWVWLLGCNPVTRHDAVASVRAGFDGAELSGFWPGDGGWRLREEAVGLFSHRFVAQRLNGPKHN